MELNRGKQPPSNTFMTNWTYIESNNGNWSTNKDILGLLKMHKSHLQFKLVGRTCSADNSSFKFKFNSHITTIDEAKNIFSDIEKCCKSQNYKITSSFVEFKNDKLRIILED